MASISTPCPKVSSVARVGSITPPANQQGRIFFTPARGPNPTTSLSSASSGRDSSFNGFQYLNRKQSPLWRRHAQLSEVTSNSAPAVNTKNKVASLEGKNESVENGIPAAPAISAFMTQVSDLVKLVDSRDIVELELKQLDCELIIRKKEALQQPAPPVPILTMPPPMTHAMIPTPPAAAPAAPSQSAPAPTPAAPAKTSQSSHPPLKCPMAGTFYRSPAPGEPPFVKVGDKVKKGQVVCIVEAMKLMNEIEADQSGTITEILAEDGKPVSVDTPLFVIVP